MKKVGKWNDKRLYVAALGGLGAVAWAYVKGDRALIITFLLMEIVAFIGYALFVPDDDAEPTERQPVVKPRKETARNRLNQKHRQ